MNYFLERKETSDEIFGFMDPGWSFTEKWRLDLLENTPRSGKTVNIP